jgi:hypothetical protein
LGSWNARRAIGKEVKLTARTAVAAARRARVKRILAGVVFVDEALSLVEEGDIRWIGGGDGEMLEELLRN